jgi:hypothetical protein
MYYDQLYKTLWQKGKKTHTYKLSTKITNMHAQYLILRTAGRNDSVELKVVRRAVRRHAGHRVADALAVQKHAEKEAEGVHDREEMDGTRRYGRYETRGNMLST